jgi:hypothetical protein
MTMVADSPSFSTGAIGTHMLVVNGEYVNGGTGCG